MSYLTFEKMTQLSTYLIQGTENEKNKFFYKVSFYKDDNGFHSDGNFCFCFKNKFSGSEKIVSSKRFDKKGFVFDFVNSSDYDPVKVFFENDGTYTGIDENSLNMIIDLHTNAANSYKDLDLFIADYFLYSIKKVFSNNSNEEILNQISELRLEDDIQNFIRDFVNTYSNSYLKNKEKIEERIRISGIDDYKERYYICQEDPVFQSQLKDCQMVFETKVNSKMLMKSNVRGNSSMALLDLVKSLDEELGNISEELKWRSSLFVPSRNMSWSKMKNKLCSEIEDYCNKFQDSFSKSGYSIITKEEQERILELENLLNIGTISKKEKEEYEKLAKDITFRVNATLVKFSRFSNNLSNLGISNELARINRLNTPESYTSVVFSPVPDIISSLNNLKKPLSQLKSLQSVQINAEALLEQRANLRKEIAKQVKREEIVEKTDNKNSNDRASFNRDFNISNKKGDILLDREKQAVINRIRSIETLKTDELKEDMIRNLLMSDLPALRDIVVKAEVLSGIKAFYWNDELESEGRQQVEKRHYHYLDFDGLYETLKSFKSDGIENEIQNTRGFNFRGRDSYGAEDLGIEHCFRHSAKNLEKVKEDIIKEKLDINDFIVDGKIDIFKILETRAKLLEKYNDLRNHANPTREQEWERQKLAYQINFIESELSLKDLGRDTLVSVKGLQDLKEKAIENMKKEIEKNEIEIEELIKSLEQIQGSEQNLTGIDLEKVEDINNEIQELRKSNERLKEQISKKQNDVEIIDRQIPAIHEKDRLAADTLYADLQEALDIYRKINDPSIEENTKKRIVEKQNRIKEIDDEIQVYENNKKPTFLNNIKKKFNKEAYGEEILNEKIAGLQKEKENLIKDIEELKKLQSKKINTEKLKESLRKIANELEKSLEKN